jgi:hypothetical protein
MVLGEVALVGADHLGLGAEEEPAVAVRVGVVDAADVSGRDHNAVLDLDQGVQL